MTHGDLHPIGSRQGALLGGETISVHKADAATSSRTNFGAALRSDLLALQFEQHQVQISPSPIGELAITYVGHSTIRHIVVHSSHVYIDQGVCAPKPKRSDPTLPTVLNRRQFAHWLHGFASARGRTSASSRLRPQSNSASPADTVPV